MSGACSVTGSFAEGYTGIHSWLDGPVRYAVVPSRDVAVLFLDTRPVAAIAFHHDLLGADDPKGFFRRPR
jgi:nicotinamide riboside kinase